MELRDKLKDKKYFEKFIVKTEKRIDNFSNKLNAKEVKEDRISNVEKKVNSLKYELIEAKYSNGEKVENLMYPFSDYLDEFLNYWTSSNYINLLWNLSIGIMLEIEDAEFKQLIALVEKDNPNDFLVDFFINSRKASWHMVNTNFKFGTPYKSLKEVVDTAQTDKQKAVKRLKQYLDKEWYKGHSDMGWHNSHKSKHNIYSGYWCWEAGALVKILGLDDSILKDQPYYPYDMVHWNE